MGWFHPAGSQARNATGVIAFPAIGPALAISYETWFKYRNMDASKKIFVSTEILVFDFELFIGDRRQKNKELMTTLSSCQTFESSGRFVPF